ncbi:MAG: hypothetical protein VX278_09855, partial [Myxococcota bacterium]|nr:hypothetical protein [Myxococcota bacterium]
MILHLIFCILFLAGCTDKSSDTCAENEYRQESEEAMCIPLRVCTATQYESVPPTANSDRECLDQTDCVPGEAVSQEATPTSDRICEPCSLGETYTATINEPICTPVTICMDDQYISTAATLTSDQQCGDCQSDVHIEYGSCLACNDENTCTQSECIQGYASIDGRCTAAPIPENATCITEEDAVVASCSCDDGFYGSLEWSAETMSWMGDCTAWTDCVPGEFVAFAGTDSTDRYCLPC